MKTIDIQKKIEDLQEITLECEQQHFADNTFKKYSSDLNRLKEKLHQEKFYLVIIGLFKRGKSSLANALIRKEILPYSVVPLTSVVTLVDHSEEDFAKIVFLDNNEKNISLDILPEYVTETLNPLNRKNVDHVYVYTNSEFLKKITIVDTPGIGSTFENNTETTYSFIDRIDAALFILSADLPISKSEVEFLTKLKTIVPKIIFVLNKIDLIKKEDLHDIISFNITVLKSIFGEEEILIYPVSAAIALKEMKNNDAKFTQKSGFHSLISEIEKMLSYEKYEVIAISAKNQFNIIHNKTEALISMRLKAFLTPVEKLNEDYQAFLISLQTMQKDKADFEILIKGKVKQLQDNVTQTINDFADALKKEIDSVIDNERKEVISSLKKNGLDIIYEKYFADIEKNYEPLKKKMEIDVVQTFKNILKEYARGSSSFFNELIKNFAIQSLFDLHDLLETFNLKIYTSFYFYFEKSYDPFYLKTKTIRNFIFPLVADKVIKHIKRTINDNISKNASRINYDINYRIQESFIQFNFDLKNKIEETLKTLKNIISDTINKKTEAEVSVSKKVNYLSALLDKLKLIKNGTDIKKLDY